MVVHYFPTMNEKLLKSPTLLDTSVVEEIELICNSPSSHEDGTSDATNSSDTISKYLFVVSNHEKDINFLHDKIPPSSTVWLDNELKNSSEGVVDDENEKDDQVIRLINEVKDRIKNSEPLKTLIFIYTNFFNDHFYKVIKMGLRIVSPFLVNHSSDIGQDIQSMKRHLYTLSMRGLIICFTGFRNREDVMEMGKLVTAMGGSLRDKMSWRVTHLIAPQAVGIKYRCALTYKIPVVSRDWIYAVWALKDDANYCRPRAATEMVDQYLIYPFHGCILAFFGFSESTLSELIYEAELNGGKVISLHDNPDDEIPTHAVVHELHTRGAAAALNYPASCEVVRVEWFWACLQKRCLEKADGYRISSEAFANSPRLPLGKSSGGSLDTSLVAESGETSRGRRSCATSKRRSRQAEFNERLIHLAQLSTDSLNSPMTSVIGRDSISYTSILDATGDSLAMDTDIGDEVVKSPLIEMKRSFSKTPDSAKKRKVSARYGKVMELIHTECNYVGILDCMVSIIKKEILDPNQPGGPILSERDTETIFRDLDPLFNVHVSLKEDLMEVATEERWANDPAGEKIEVGPVMLRHLADIKRVYPHFVNFYDQRKDSVEELAKKHHRFHAYLRRCQSRKETGRNSIVDLMIRPVQRLPSMMLILQDLLKHTDESFSDHAHLESAITELRSVLSSINEDKRRTEGFLAVFNVVHSIDGCPADLASSHRLFLAQVDVVEVTDKLADIGQGLTIFLFSDQIEICRRKRNANVSRNGSVRSNAGNYGDDISILSSSTVSIPTAVATASGGFSNVPSTPGPSISSSNASSVGGHGPCKKKYKHVMLVPLAEIECATDLRKNIGMDDEYRAFALVLRKKANDKPNDIFAFAITDDTDKLAFLHMVAQQILITTCQNGNIDCLVNEMAAGAFNIDIEEAFRRHTISGKAKRLRQRVSRVLSFSRTPRKMKRAVSHLPSSGMVSIDGSTGNLLGLNSPSVVNLRDSTTSMETTFTPSRNFESGGSRSVAALTPMGSKEQHGFNRMSTSTLPVGNESFRETVGVDPDALFQCSPPTPDHPHITGSVGRPSLAVRFQQHLSNVFRRSGGSRLSMAPSLDESTVTEKKKKARLTTIFGQSNSINRTRMKGSNKRSIGQPHVPPKVGAKTLSVDLDNSFGDSRSLSSTGLRRLRNRAGSLVSDSCILPKLHAVQEFRKSNENKENSSISENDVSGKFECKDDGREEPFADTSTIIIDRDENVQT